jgi:hypothetical protein
VGAPLHLAGAHGQERLGPVESLDLALLIDTEHHRLLGGMQVEADDVGDLLLQLRIGAVLEAAGPMGLEIVIPPDPEHRGLADPDPLRDFPARPMRLALGGTTQRGADDLRHHLLIVGPRPATSRGVLFQAGHPCVLEAPTPEQDRRNGTVGLLGDRRVGDAFGGLEHDVGAEDLALRQGPTPGPGGQGSPAVVVEAESGSGTIGHADSILAPLLIVKLFVDRCTSWSAHRGC